MNNDLTNLNVRVEGRVLKYDAERSFGFVRIISQDFKLNNKDAFVYYKDIEPSKDCFKKLLEGQMVEFDLYKGARGFTAKNLEILPEQEGDYHGNR